MIAGGERVPETTFYGGDGTWHQTGQLDVETRNGKVVAVWFRCHLLPFQQIEVDRRRAKETRTESGYTPPAIYGITFEKEEA